MDPDPLQMVGGGGPDHPLPPELAAGGGFCGHLGFEILRNFVEILRNFMEFCGNFVVCRNFAVKFLPGLGKICSQPDIAKKFAVSTSKIF